MKASIIITSYRRPQFLLAVLGSIARQNLGGLDYELLVINDGPADDETEWVATQSEAASMLNMRYIHTGKRNSQDWRTMGFAANIGIQQADGEIVVLSNSDMYHVGTTVAPVIEASLKDPMAISTVGRVIEDDGALIGHLTVNEDKFNRLDRARTKIISRLRRLPVVEDTSPVNPDMPFFMAIRREHLLHIGGYDEDFIGCAADDNDLMERLIQHGCHYHYGPKTSELVHLFHNRRTIPQLKTDPGYQYNVDLWDGKRGQLVRNQGRVWGRLAEDTEPYEDSPIHMVLWVTSQCSLDCPMCNQAPARQLDPEYNMGIGELKRFIGSCQSRGLHFSTIELTGGEPTMWGIFERGIELLRESGVCDDITFITNGRDPEATVDVAKRHGVRYTVSTYQADPAHVDYHKDHGVAVMWNEHSHSPVPDKLMPTTLPAICSQRHDRQGQSVQQLLYYQGDVYYCCNALAYASVAVGDDGMKCSFDEDFSGFFKTRRFDKQACSMCLCNLKVIEKMAAPHFEYLMINFGGGCNNRCIFCGTPPATPENTIRIQDFGELRDLIDSAEFIDITSSGEITCHPDFEELVCLLRFLGKPFLFATNGTLLHKWVDLIHGSQRKGSVNNIRVSLNSLVPETYKLLCGDDHEQVLKNIDMVLDRDIPGFCLTTSYVITSHNWTEIPDIIDYVVSRGIQARFFDLTPTLTYPPGLQVQDTPENRQQLEEWKQYAKSKGADTWFFDFDTRTVTPTDVARLSERIKKCRDPYVLCGITPGMEVSPCCWPGLVMGNLRDNSMAEIWNGAAYKELRQCLSEGNPKYCMDCGKQQ